MYAYDSRGILIGHWPRESSGEILKLNAFLYIQARAYAQKVLKVVMCVCVGGGGVKVLYDPNNASLIDKHGSHLQMMSFQCCHINVLNG